MPVLAQTPRPVSRGDWFSDLFGFTEGSAEELRNLLLVVPGSSPDAPCALESAVTGARFGVGCFETPSLAELRTRGAAVSLPGALRVVNDLGDVSAKHAEEENRHATFQVASQFNCLEFVGPSVKPEDGVTGYIGDRTQGPACAITCGPATVYRNYFVPLDAAGRALPACSKGAVQVGQTKARQLENLQELNELLGNKPAGKLFDVRGGYTLADERQLRGLNAALAQLQKQGRRDEALASLRIGVQSDVQVTSCCWNARKVRDAQQTVTQVYGSACSVAYNHASSAASWEDFATLVLEASYEATLWAAVLAAHRHGGAGGSRRVFLTCLGGGVFGNSMDWIALAMRRAFERFRDFDLDIRIVTYAGRIDPRLQALERDFVGRK